MLSIIKSIFYTFYINLKAFKFVEAIKLPIICGPYVCFGDIEKGKIHFIGGVSFNKISIGRTLGSFRGGARQRTFIHIGKNADLNIKSKFDIPCGSTININGRLDISENFMPNFSLLISCENKITIGKNCNIGWNVTIIDGDGHPLCKIDEPLLPINLSKPVFIGDNCWIAANASILKGVYLSDNTIIPYGSIITKSCNKPNVIFGGLPNAIIKANVARMDFIKKNEN